MTQSKDSKKCKICGSLIERPANATKYCSKPCRKEAQKRDNKRWKRRNRRRTKFYQDSVGGKASRLATANKDRGEGRFTGPEVQALYKRQPNCPLCGRPVDKEDMSIDHIIPIVFGGSNTIDNIQIMHTWCNIFKRDMPMEKALAKYQRIYQVCPADGGRQ